MIDFDPVIGVLVCLIFIQDIPGSGDLRRAAGAGGRLANDIVNSTGIVKSKVHIHRVGSDVLKPGSAVVELGQTAVGKETDQLLSIHQLVLRVVPSPTRCM